jgi:CitB family two-component system sensor histidine kinase CitS
MKRFLRVTIQIKILGLVIFLLLLVLGSLTFMVAYMETQEDVEKAEELALQTAKTLSYMPIIQQAFKSENPLRGRINAVAEQIRDQVNASTIKIENRKGELYGFAGEDGTDQPTSMHDRYRSLLYGSNVISNSGEGENQVLKGIVPIIIYYEEYTKVEGTVIVEFSMKAIRIEIASDIRKMLLSSGLVFLIGIAGSFLLARSIRKDTLGLEPYEIATLFRERNAILQSVKEGIIAIDHSGVITIMNISAQEMLGIDVNVEGLAVSKIILSEPMLEALKSNKGQLNKELQYKDKVIIVSTQLILENGQKVGMVASFRDKTEIKKMVDALSEVRQYSEDLRAQAHEFTNKLHVILGLIQLGKHDEATKLIQEEAQLQEQHTELFFNSIRDEKVQAILLGKLAKASEKKINFKIDGDSSLQSMPGHIRLSPLIVILGNLLDNAFEAAADSIEKRVLFFVIDIGKDIIFEIGDSGPGIDSDIEEFIFQKGFSLKGNNRGYGLANVKEEIELLGGSIELMNRSSEGTVFTIILPKIVEREG